MANPWAGQVVLTINGQDYALKLTLGALAALEARLEEASLVALVERFETGAFCTRDVLELLHAGLMGGGHTVDMADLAQGDIGGGPMAAARSAAELLVRAFMVPGDTE